MKTSEKKTCFFGTIPIHKRKIAVCVLLSIVTCGIYFLYWEYLLVKTIRAMQNNKSRCTGEMLCLILVPFYSLYWWLSRGDTVREKFEEYGRSAKGSGILYLIFSVFGLSIVSAAFMQSDFNALLAETGEQDGQNADGVSAGSAKPVSRKGKEKAVKPGGMEALRRRYGYAFVGHWIVGLVVFFFVPVLYSIAYAFSDIAITAGGMKLTFVGFKNFSQNLLSNPDYVDQIRDSLGSMFYSLPMVVALSLILAVLLNQKYHGRAIMRVIFFLPVIIESSVVVRLLSDGSINSPIFNTAATDGTGLFDYSQILGHLNLPEGILGYFTFFLSNAVNLTWSCGIQIVLFLAGLQSIPDSLYEVSKIEGANKWEEFWMITVPMLRHVLSLVIVYTMISMFTSANNTIMQSAVTLISNNGNSLASAMLWFYFVIVLAAIGLVLFLYNKLCIKKWE